jgi:hypothetical protein
MCCFTGGLTSAGQMGSFQPSANHRHAKQSAIGLRSSEVSRQPNVPNMIRSATESDVARTYSYYSSQNNAGGIAEGSQVGGVIYCI